MADIKVKQSKKGTIKTLNKNVIKVQKIKDNLVSAKEKTKETYEKDYNSGTDYATNRITNNINNRHIRYKWVWVGKKNQT